MLLFKSDLIGKNGSSEISGYKNDLVVNGDKVDIDDPKEFLLRVGVGEIGRPDFLKNQFVNLVDDDSSLFLEDSQESH